MDNEAKFPVVSKIASKYLAFPATSGPTGWIFLTEGVLVSKIHNRLSADTVDKMFLFLIKTLFKVYQKQLQFCSSDIYVCSDELKIWKCQDFVF
jgi:hypothetical protein